jgi:3-hydroxypropanoate dehydrogenase
MIPGDEKVPPSAAWLLDMLQANKVTDTDKETTMTMVLSEDAVAQLFTEARSFTSWTEKPVDDQTLHEIYDLMKMGPTSANLSPARLIFVRSPEAKTKLLACVSPANVEKVRSAPVTAIVAMDERFYDQIGKLLPQAPQYRDYFANDKLLSESTAFRNSSLQGAYFMLAARAMGLDCGPMSGFDNAKLDAAFLADTTWKSNFICNLGYGDRSHLHPRLPRLSFEEACQIR